MWKPSGVCIQELATMIQMAEKVEPEGDHEGGEEVRLLAHAVPAEDEQGEKAAFQEEGEDALGGQGAAEDIADVAGVGGPVGAELEFHDDAAGDADGEDQGEDFDPELGHFAIERCCRCAATWTP